ncbi:hypothetical protein STRDD11_00849 [Streptococcus sp. DD11]|nr:hypothetical protein STRDD11_00849 [Streptococcus sp. DD11]
MIFKMWRDFIHNVTFHSPRTVLGYKVIKDKPNDDKSG